MQHSTFVSPDIFRLLFKPVYQRVAAECHDRNMKLFVHSCGLVTGFIEDFIDAGVDVMQFDQPEIYGSANLARNYGGRMAFHCPVDIQKVMATGNREYIEKTAYEMVTAFKTICGGGLIAKDYPSWQDINVEQEWADWARKVIVQNSAL
ncbi:MAG: uroporphyrinogen decarboxylase family protein [Bianqueaceae bacterium]